MNSPYLAAVDVGTNSFHLVVVKLLPDNSFTVLRKEKIIVRLGESASQIKHLTEEAMERGVDAMKLFGITAERMEVPLRAVATSAVREAENGEDFIERVYESTGIEIEVVSGFEEARLIYLGVIQALAVVNERIALFDIGGGSTEILVGERGTSLYANSFKIGAIRMTQRFFPKETISKNQVEKLRLFLRGELYFAAQEVRKRGPKQLIASSGTALTIAAMTLADQEITVPEPLNGVSIKLAHVRKVVKQIIKAKSFDERAKMPGCDPRRADILAAGAVVLQTIMEELGFEKFTISSYALREGIILDTVQKRAGSEGETPIHLSDLRYDTVMKIGRIYNFDEAHGIHVAKLALQLYDDLSSLHKLKDDSRELLEAAALLHDIGYYISHASHHKHALYLIQNSEMLGFNDEEIAVIANVARYHRKSHPKLQHAEFAELDSRDQHRVGVLAGILRIADGLDRTHRRVIHDIRTTYSSKKISIATETALEEEATFEYWSVERKKGLLEEVLDRHVQLQMHIPEVHRVV